MVRIKEFFQAGFRTNLFLGFFLLLVQCPLQSQLIVDDTYTAQQLVQDVLVGNGVQVSNVTYTGDPIQTGFFDATNANMMSIDSGMIMSSGDVNHAIGPNDQATSTSFSGGIDGDVDLEQANGGIPVNDICIIEFDFVPQGDTIEFDYLFGSEEYMTYAQPSSTINDVFAFFISGPGIAGPYSNNAENIATVPGTNQAVTLNTVNNWNNSAYYVNNGDGDNATPPPPNYDTDPAYIQYDGHTVVLTAKRAVMCDSTYHFKLAIADGSDDIIDSGVFLKANSLTSKAITVDTEIDLGQNDSTIWEGCGGISFDLVREGDTSLADTVYLEKSGSATEGVDYTSLPDSLFFTPGQDSLLLSTDAIADGVNEGTEEVIIDIIYKDPSACSTWDTSTVEFQISDPDTLQLTTSADTSVGACSDSIEIWAAATGGYGDYQWTWNQGIPNGDSTGKVGPNTTTTYVVDVSDTCGVGNPSDSITVNVPSFDPLQVHTFNDTHYVCPSQDVPVGIDSISGGSGNTEFWWDLLGTDSSYMVNPDQTTTYEVTAVDSCLNDTATGTVQVVKAFDPLQVEAYPDTTVCAGEPVRLGATFRSGGTGDVEYFWEPDSIYGDPVWTKSDSLEANSNSTKGNTTYQLTATDSCGVTDTSSMLVTYQNPEAAFHHTSKVKETGSPIHFFNDSRGGDFYFWDFGNEVFATTAYDTVLSYKQPGTYRIMLGARDDLGCTDTTWDEIEIVPPFNYYVPNAFSPDGDGLNDEFIGKGAGVAEFHMRVFNRWGEVVFESEDPERGWDGTIGGKPAPQGVYVYKISVKGMNGEAKDFEGHLTLIR